jgi:uncharacterized OB-fold protein
VQYQDRLVAAPGINPEGQPYWEAATAGKLLVKYCTACSQYHHYPRALCPFCLSDKTEWREAKGTGTLYSYSVSRRATPPFTMAYVTLEEGVTMMTNLVDCDFDQLKIGQKVRVVFKPSEGGPMVPMFTPA